MEKGGENVSKLKEKLLEVCCLFLLFLSSLAVDGFQGEILSY